MEKPLLLLVNGVLRLSDHPALVAAAASGRPVIPVFVFDPSEPWALGGASRWWLRESLNLLGKAYNFVGSSLVLRLGKLTDEIEALLVETDASALYLTRFYTPEGVAAEKTLQRICSDKGVQVDFFEGRLLLEPEDVRSGSGTPYSVFTPFWKQAQSLVADTQPLAAPESLLAPLEWPKSCDLAQLQLDPKPARWAEPIAAVWDVGEAAAQARLKLFLDEVARDYSEGRDRPGIDGTSRISPYLAFGEISPRQIWHASVQAMTEASATGIWAFLRELGWREFSTHTLYYNPHMPEKPLKAQFNNFPWQSADEKTWAAWTKGLTGFPVVDAGMRQLWQTGWMHNRVRMIVASFLVKDLLVWWQEGERWFWDTLVDADLANNSASWQWVAGCGNDASPYFRIFNPVTQGEKFDKNGDYIRAFVPELAKLPNAYIHRPFEAPDDVLEAAGIKLGETYPHPIVDRKVTRERALAALASIKT